MRVQFFIPIPFENRVNSYNFTHIKELFRFVEQDIIVTHYLVFFVKYVHRYFICNRINNIFSPNLSVLSAFLTNDFP